MGVLVADWKDMYDKLNEQYGALNKKYNLLGEKCEELWAAGGTNESLNKSDYWCQFEKSARKAIADYPAWRDTQGKVQKTGNLQVWLTETIGVDNREAEILKKVLSDVFHELK